MCDATRWWCGPASVISNGSHLIIMLLIEVCHLLLLVENYVTQMRNECGRCKWMWWRWKSFRRRLSDSILAASMQAYTTHHTRIAHMSQMTPCKRCHSHIRQSIPSSNYKWMCGCRAWPFAPQFQNYTKSFVRVAPSDELTSSTMVKEMHFFNRFSSRSPSIFFLSLSSSAFKNALENVLAECAINILYIFHHFYCVCSLFVFIVHPSPFSFHLSFRMSILWQCTGTGTGTPKTGSQAKHMKKINLISVWKRSGDCIVQDSNCHKMTCRALENLIATGLGCERSSFAFLLVALITDTQRLEHTVCAVC